MLTNRVGFGLALCVSVVVALIYKSDSQTEQFVQPSSEPAQIAALSVGKGSKESAPIYDAQDARNVHGINQVNSYVSDGDDDTVPPHSYESDEESKYIGEDLSLVDIDEHSYPSSEPRAIGADLSSIDVDEHVYDDGITRFIGEDLSGFEIEDTVISQFSDVNPSLKVSIGKYIEVDE